MVFWYGVVVVVFMYGVVLVRVASTVVLTFAVVGHVGFEYDVGHVLVPL